MAIGFSLCGEIKIWRSIREFVASSKSLDETPSMIFGSSWGTSNEKLGCLNKESCQRESMFNLIKLIWSS